jgi:hypothetical protein
MTLNTQKCALSHQTHSAIALPQQLRSPYWGNNTAIVLRIKNCCKAEKEMMGNRDRQAKL